MSNLVQLKNIKKSYTTKVLFEDETLSVNEGEHIGLIGPNGAGKTTLFKVLVGEVELDSGQLICSRDLRLGYLPQHDLWNDEESIEDYLTHHCQMPIWELKKIGLSLGLKDEDYSKPVVSFSGGYRMRVKLLAMIGEEPNLMLLDEPTNYLDLETILVLEEFLKSFQGSFILISHDRHFLRKTVNKIVEVQGGRIRKADVGFDKFLEYKKMLMEESIRKHQKIEEEKKEIIDFANRFRAKATKAKQVQSRLKRLDKLEEVEIESSYQSANITLPKPTHTGKQIIKVENGHFGYDSNVVLKNVNFAIQRGDHFGVVGFNGAGKSTLLKGLVGQLSPLSGTVEHGFEVKIGFYAQHVIEHLNLDHNIIESIDSVAHPSVTSQEVIDLAGSLMFSGNDTKKKLKVLSGGELARVTLARVLVQKAPCLILDEPTNHLDFETVTALGDALKKYEGTVIVVSHDRDFIAKISDKIIEIRDGGAIPYPGTYDEYVWSLEKGILSEVEASPKAPTVKAEVSSQASENSLDRKKQKEMRKQLQKLEKALQAQEKKIESLQEKISNLSNELTRAQDEELLNLTAELTMMQVEISTLESDWESNMEAKEEVEQQLSVILGE